jgi:hypothetical protein
LLAIFDLWCLCDSTKSFESDPIYQQAFYSQSVRGPHNMNRQELFSVEGIVAVITGGGTGKSDIMNTMSHQLIYG